MSLPDNLIAFSSSPQPTSDSTPAVYTLFAVFRVSSSHPSVFDGRDVAGVVREFEDVVDVIKSEEVTLRGYYDVSGLRADADLMLWLHGSTAEDLQWALRLLRRTALLKPLIRVWSTVGVQREAEFGEDYEPGFVSGIAPKQWLSVHPIARSASWHLLDPADHQRLLEDQLKVQEQYPDVTANIVAGYSLGSYEWILPMEADELTDLVDTARALRAVNEWKHIREDTEYYTGRRIELAEVVEVLQ